MFEDGFAENFVEFESFDFEMTSSVDLEGKFKEFGDVFASDTTSNENWSVGEKIEVAFEAVEDFVDGF